MLCLAPRHVIWEALGDEVDGGEGDAFPSFTAGFMSRSAR